ncbi:MAG: autotransporter-associated beta strand repeat-containing protein, partial [Kiritimatiellaeota bacterium]|nr:autotransporter-associated beta strand repeat-containing protein [Kiritimatiellota bacterium]
MMRRAMMLAAAWGLAGVAAMGAGIVWDTDANGDSPYRIAGEADVRTDGVLLYAYTGASVTVNTVTFGVYPGADLDLSFGSTHNAYGSESVLPPYATLLNHGIYRDGGSPHEVTLKNLTPGDYYLVQFWVNDARSSIGNLRSEVLGSVGGNTVRVDFQDTAQNALRVGQYAIGYFVADDVTQSFSITGHNGQMNAIQVRKLPTGASLLVRADSSLTSVAVLSPWSQFVEAGESAACELKAVYGYKIMAVYTNGTLYASPGNGVPFTFVLEDVRESVTVSADVVRDASVPPSYIGNSGDWSDAGKWASGLVADNGETAQFVTQNNQTISVDAPVLLGGLYMTQNVLFNAAGGGSLTFADEAVIRAYGNSTTVFYLPLKGTGGTITKRGSGGVSQNTLNVRFTDLFEDFATVNLMGGLLEFTAAGTVAVSTGNVTLAGSRLVVAPSADTAAQVIAGGGTFTVGPGPNLIKMTKHGDSPTFDLTLGGALAHLPGGMLPLNRTGWDGEDTKIFLAQPPALVNGMLPPWMASVIESSGQPHFVTYDATDGIVDATTVNHSLAAATDIAEVSASVSFADGTAFHALEVNNATVTLDGTLTLGDGVNPTGIILNSGTVQNNTIDIGGSDLYIWNRNADGNVDGSNLKSVITGSGGISFCSSLYPNWGECKNLQFNPASPCTYTGPTYISGTRVNVTGIPHSPFGPGDIYIHGNESRLGGQLYVSANLTLPNNLHISGFGADQEAALRLQGNVEIPGTIEVMDYAGIQVYANPLVLSNLIYGPGKLRFRYGHDNAPHSVVLSHANTYSGGTEILSLTVQLDHPEGLGSGAVELQSYDSSRLRFNNAQDWVFTNTLFGAGSLAKINTGRLTITDFRGAAANMKDLTIADGDVTLPNCAWGFLNTAMDPASALTLQPGPVRNFTVIGNNAAASSLASLGGPASLVKGFFNTLTMDGASTYTGPTLINAGTLQAMCADTLPPVSTLIMDNLSTLDLNGFSQTVAGLSGSGRVISAAPATLTFGDAQDTSFEGYIDGGLTLAKQGPGTATLASANTYSGDTLISGGTLKLRAFDRTPPQDPAAIATVSLWLDASNSASLSAAHDDPVSLWQDLSANGNAFETASADPTFTEPTVDGAKLNGLNMVRFSRAQRTRLETRDYEQPVNVRTFAAVLIPTDADGGAGGADGIFGRKLLHPVEGQNVDHGLRRGGLYNNGYTFNQANNFAHNFFVNGMQTAGFIDKEPLIIVTTRNDDGNNMPDMSLGGFYANDRCFSGWMGEVIGFTTTLTMPQRQQVEGYLRAKWFGTDPVPAASSNLLPTATSVILSNGATLDLGGTEQTVAELI